MAPAANMHNRGVLTRGFDTAHRTDQNLVFLAVLRSPLVLQTGPTLYFCETLGLLPFLALLLNSFLPALSIKEL